MENVQKIIEALMREAGIEQLVCKPNPLTGELVCAITEHQAEALEKAGFEPRRVVFEVVSETRREFAPNDNGQPN